MASSNAATSSTSTQNEMEIDWFDENDGASKSNSGIKRKNSIDSNDSLNESNIECKTGRYDVSSPVSEKNILDNNTSTIGLDEGKKDSVISPTLSQNTNVSAGDGVDNDDDINGNVGDYDDHIRDNLHNQSHDNVEKQTEKGSGRQKVGSIRMTSMPNLSQYGSYEQNQYIQNRDDDDFKVPRYHLKKDQKHFNKRHPPQPEPESAEFPIILEDIGDSKKGDKRFSDFGQFTESLFRESGLAPIRRQRRLASGKWMIHCNSAMAQHTLANRTCLGKNDDVKVRCIVPSHKTIGVIRSIPISVSMEQITKGNKDIISASRLKLRDGGESRAVKVFFSTKELPNEIRLGNEIVLVTPFVDPVLRCTKCQKFNHTKAKCTIKIPICPNCGKRAHDENDHQKNRQMCPATVSFCVNCQTAGHSAAWGGCPKLKLLQKAKVESSRLGVPVGLVLHKIDLTNNEPT